MATTIVSSGQTLTGAVVSGTLEVQSGGTIVGTTLLQGTLTVDSGGVALNTLVTGGTETVAGVDSGSVINGGSLAVTGGGTVVGTTLRNNATTYVFAGSIVGPVVSNGVVDVISGSRITNASLALGASILLQGVAFSAGGSATLNSSTDVLTVTEGSTVSNIQLAGNYAGESFALSAGNGEAISYGFGTYVTVITAPIPVPNGLGGFDLVTTSSPLQTAFAQQVAAAAAATPGAQTISTQNPRQPQQAVTLTSPVLIDLPDGFDTITGTSAIPFAQVLLDNPTATYVTAGTAVSIVVAADAVSDVVVNNNPGGVLLAVTGAATFNGSGDTLEGLAGANQFVTGNGGRDAVLLDGAANNLTTNGTDLVLVGGPSTITAAAGGLDNVLMTAGTTLAFINTSSPQTVDSVRGAANGIVLLAGPGSTAVTAGPGTQFFFVDTSAGNTTLNGGVSGVNAFTFVKDSNNATAQVQVNNLTQNDIVAIHGYTGFNVQAAPGGAVLSLSDGAQVTFTGVSAAAVQQAVRVT